ncbi:LPS export ABC transporter periplasmic protein LptC [bacterium]|jgi:LPS export ABC transporter protein LptC|nr:LPS export ABC transporter periplasmic protein LptC [bacterium]
MAISANHFFIALALLLSAILYFFKPMHVQDTVKGEIAQLELRNFTLYELGVDGLKDIMIGRHGLRFDDRIEVKDIDYTDSSRQLQNNLQADFGVYNNKDLITLEGNVRYYREDGLKFNTNKAIIDQNKETITTVGPFTLEKFSEKAVGMDLFYDNKNGRSKAEDVTGIFDLAK